VTMTSTRQTKVEVFIVGSLSHATAHNLLCNGVCWGSRVCAGVFKSVSIVSHNETCCIDIRSIDD